ncbi:MAG: hypothetical protein ACYSVY_01350 [Planctomycetota bacterium]|jgi:hypothetical protein
MTELSNRQMIAGLGAFAALMAGCAVFVWLAGCVLGWATNWIATNCVAGM